MSRWVRVDRRYSNPYRLTGYAYRAALKWIGLVFAWIVVNTVLAAAHAGILALVTTAGLIWYAVRCFRAGRRSPLLARRRSPADGLALQSGTRMASGACRLVTGAGMAARPVLAACSAGVAPLGAGP